MASISSWSVEMGIVEAVRLVHDYLVVAFIVHGLLLLLVLVLVALAVVCRGLLKVNFVVLVRGFSLREATGHSTRREPLILVLNAASLVESGCPRLSHGVTLSAVVIDAGGGITWTGFVLVDIVINGLRLAHCSEAS